MSEVKLTIGMACYDDPYGVYQTVTSLITHHGVYRSRDDIEIIVVDNNPTSELGKLTREWVVGRTKAKYIPFTKCKGTAQPREEVFKQAKGKYVLCLDCHVFIYPGAIDRLLEYLEDNPDTADLLQGPHMTDSGTACMGTHQRPEWGSGAYGKWTQDDRWKDDDAEPFTIWQQGLGLFCCKRDEWVHFHPEFRGFGGCETYIAEKFRRKGANVLCLPFLKWTHRYFKTERTDKPDKLDQARNYLIGFLELDMDIQPIMDEFNLDEEDVQRLINNIEIHPKPRPSVAALAAGGSSRKIAVVGCTKYGPVKMRGLPLVEEFGFKLIKCREISRHYDIIIAIKDTTPKLRVHCDHLILDPCDSFFAGHSKFNRAADYWKQVYGAIPYNHIIATSPACRDTMLEAVPDIPVTVVPHHCDSKLEGEYDPEGPVVYAGQKCFIETQVSAIQIACKAIGRDFNYGFSQKLLDGASLCLALRLPPYDSDLNRRCKPQIKLENAARIGLPVLSTDDPAALSLYPSLVTISPKKVNRDTLVTGILEALATTPLSHPFTEDDYLEAIQELLYG